MTASATPVRRFFCGGCETTWTAFSAAHCGAPGCHQHFASVRLFDLHRRHGACLDPALLTTRAGEPIMTWRDGAWRGPERPADVIAALRGAG